MHTASTAVKAQCIGAARCQIRSYVCRNATNSTEAMISEKNALPQKWKPCSERKLRLLLRIK